MANDIRTRPPNKDIKILDRTEAAISYIKDVAVKTKDTANEAKSQNEGTVQEYASNKVTHSTETIASGTVYQAGKTVKRTIKSIKKRREKTMQEQENVQNSANGDVDHVGIVESVVNGTIYTIEGNSGDMCRRRSYSIGYYEIYGVV